MDRPRADLTIVVPTYNERDGLADLVDAALAAAAAAAVALEVVVVDDNSPDGTGALADELARTRPVTVIHRTGKLGLGSAVMDGVRAATTDVVGVMDADFSHPPALVPRLFRAFEATGADLVVASRYVPGGGASGWPPARRAMSWLACFLARGLSPIRDATSGFFLIRRAIAAPAVIRAGGFKICLELIVRAGPGRLVEVPFEFSDRRQGRSKMSAWEVIGYLRQLVALYWLRISGRRRGEVTYQRISPERLARLGSPPRAAIH